MSASNTETSHGAAPSYTIKLGRAKDGVVQHPKGGQTIQATASVRISVRQPAAQPLKVPPPVAAKPAKKVYPPSSAEFIDTSADEFPPPPPDMMDKPLSIEDELDALTDILALSLQNTNDPEFFGVCCKCRNTISGEGNGCTAMGDMYHVTCFVCEGCKTKLTGLEFYCLNDTPYCEQCYKNSLEDCVICKDKITDRILKAVGFSYHPKCFACVSCDKNLDGIPFTLDAANTVHCVECYQLRFSPRCAVCENLIMPSNDRGETVHIVSMQKNFHVECYKCEDCEILLSSEEGRGCYPLDGHLLCQRCNGIRIQFTAQKQPTSSKLLSTEL